DAAAPSKVRRVTRPVVERSCCMAFPPPSRRRASRRLARIIGRRGNGCLCAPEGFGRFHLGIAAREADVLQQGVVEAGQLAALAQALPPDCGQRDQLAGRGQPGQPGGKPSEQSNPEHGLLLKERSSGGGIHHGSLSPSIPKLSPGQYSYIAVAIGIRYGLASI